jgi:hypothetical protein
MKIYRAENTSLYGTRWIFAKSERSAKQIGLACGMVRYPKNLTITEEPEETFKHTDAKDVKAEGIGHLWQRKDGKCEWEIINKNEILKSATSYNHLVC